MFQEVVLEEGQREASFEMEVSNTTDAMMTLRLSAMDFGSLDESGGVAFLGAGKDFENKYGLASWVDLDRDAVVIGPGERQTIRIRIENRESLSPGGHYGAILFKLENGGGGDGDNGAKIALNQSFSALIFVKKVGGEIYNLDLKDFEIKKGLFSLPESVRLRFQNKGNVHVAPRGTVTVTDPMGRTVRKGIVNQESALILPETFRVYATALRSVASAFVPGMYTLSIAYRFDGRDDFVSQTSRFFYIPPFEIALVIVLIGGIVWRKKKKQLK